MKPAGPRDVRPRGERPVQEREQVAPQKKAEQAAPAAAPASPEAIRKQGTALGVKPYTEAHPVAQKPVARDDLAALGADAGRLADVAVAYARVGKLELARKRLGDAREKLAEIEQRGKPVELSGTNVHVGMWRHQGEAQAVLQHARAAVERAESDAAALAASGVQPIQKEPARKKTVLLFGLSANPPTGMGGHAGIVDWGARKLRADIPNDAEPERARENVAMDEVWVLPVYKHAFSSKRDLPAFEHRQAMAKLAFEHLPGLEGKVKVQDTEKRVIEEAHAQAKLKGTPPEGVKVGTIDIVRKLLDEHPDTQFVLALGGDTFADLKAGKWKEGDTLQQLVPIVVIPRKGVEGIAGSEENAPELSDISSTKVRGSTDLEFLSQALHPDVLKYMIDNKLYGFGEAVPSAGNGSK